MSDLMDYYLQFPPEFYLNRENDVPAEPTYSKVKRISFGPQGVRTWLEDEPYEVKGYFERRHERAVSDAKRLIVCIMRAVVTLRPIREFGRFLNRVLRDYYWKPEYYLPGGQEIYYAGLGEQPSETRFNIVMLLVMLYEFDDQYRYRFQFVMQEINRYQLSKHPRLELRRICAIMKAREESEGLKEKWTLVRKLIPFMPVRKIARFLLALDEEKFALDEADLYWANKKKLKFNYN